MTPFRWKNGRAVADIEAHEAALLRQVVSEVREVLRDPDSDPEADPNSDAGSDSESEPEPAMHTSPDAVVARLLPDGHRSDPDLAQDYRWLTESGLRQEKLADAALFLDTVSENGGRVELDENGAEAWIRTLNDVRLALGVQLDVEESDDPLARAEETGDPRWAAYSWLSAVQGLLVDVLATRQSTGT